MTSPSKSTAARGAAVLGIQAERKSQPVERRFDPGYPGVSHVGVEPFSILAFGENWVMGLKDRSLVPNWLAGH